jgi:hypothetical protein
MKKNPRTSRQVVNRFLSGTTPIQGEMLSDVVRSLRLDSHSGVMKEMTCLLEKALHGNRLFEYTEGGQNFFEPLEARRRRLGLPKWASKATIIKGIVLEPAFA